MKTPNEKLDWPYLDWPGHNIIVPPNIIVDIDHCISHAHWRDGLIGEWDEYHEAAMHDRPIVEMKELLLAMSTKWIVVAITARPEKWRLLTLNWMNKHEIPIDVLLMRPNDCYDASCDLKINLAKAHFGEPLNKHVAFIIDDKDDICARFRAEGISSLQIFARTRDNV